MTAQTDDNGPLLGGNVESAFPIDEADQQWHDAGHPVDMSCGSAWDQECRVCLFEEPQSGGGEP